MSMRDSLQRFIDSVPEQHGVLILSAMASVGKRDMTEEERKAMGSLALARAAGFAISVAPLVIASAESLLENTEEAVAAYLKAMGKS